MLVERSLPRRVTAATGTIPEVYEKRFLVHPVQRFVSGGSLEFIKSVINAGHMMYILDCDLVQGPVIDNHVETAIFLLYEKDRYPIRACGRLYVPLSKRSLVYLLASANSARERRYKGREGGLL